MAIFKLKKKKFSGELARVAGNIVSRAWKSGASGKAKVLGAAASLGTVGLSTASLLGKRSNSDGKKN